MTLVRSVYGDCLIVFSSFLFSRSFDARRHTLTHTVICLQMSSEDNSNRADSGNAFEGASLSSLTFPVSRLHFFLGQSLQGENRLPIMMMMLMGAQDRLAVKMMLRRPL